MFLILFCVFSLKAYDTALPQGGDTGLAISTDQATVWTSVGLLRKFELILNCLKSGNKIFPTQVKIEDMKK